MYVYIMCVKFEFFGSLEVFETEPREGLKSTLSHVRGCGTTGDD